MEQLNNLCTLNKKLTQIGILGTLEEGAGDVPQQDRRRPLRAYGPCDLELMIW